MDEKVKCFENDAGIHITFCAQCGYRFVRGDEILRLNHSRDLIHRDCFIDYCDDNIDELAYGMEY